MNAARTLAAPSRRSLFATTASALLAGAGIATTAHAAPGASAGGADIDAEVEAYRPDRRPDDMQMLRLMMIANGSKAPIRGRALAMVADEALRLAGLEPADPHSDDAELITACHDFLTAETEAQADNVSDDDDDAATAVACDHWYDALERLTALPARTRAGLRMKAQAAHIALLSTEVAGGEQREEAAALSALADLADPIGRAGA